MGVNGNILIDIQLEPKQSTIEKWMTFSSIIVRSVRNKHIKIYDFVVDHKLDVFGHCRNLVF